VWSAAFILSHENISNPPHESSSIKGTFSINQKTIGIVEVKNLIGLCVVFPVFRDEESSFNCELNISQTSHINWHNGKFSILWNDDLSISCVYCICLSKSLLKNFSVLKFLSRSWRFSECNTTKITDIDS
jgi:hypothetical protein